MWINNQDVEDVIIFKKYIQTYLETDICSSNFPISPHVSQKILFLTKGRTTQKYL